MDGLQSFLRQNGGPAGCADQFAAINPRGRYPGCVVYRHPGTGLPYLIVQQGRLNRILSSARPQSGEKAV